MIIREILPEERTAFNQVVTHPLQSWEWGEFRKKTGVEVVRLGEFEGDKMISGFQITLHPLPKFSQLYIGYMPKSILPEKKVFAALKDLALAKQIVFFKLEPNVYYPVSDYSSSNFTKSHEYLTEMGCIPGRPLFTKYSFMLDLTKSEEELLAQMKSKTRYNVRLAERKGVVVSEDNSPQAFEDYLRLTFEETTKRQGFYAHNRQYHRDMWETMYASGIAHLLKATYQGQTLVTWIVFTFNNILYYPYGASSSENREVMASNLIMWEAIRFGKRMNCRTFDMWGSLGPNPNSKDPWIGFHRFKEGYGPTLMEFVGTYDYVIDEPKYKLYTVADNLRWKWLKLKAKLPF
ncbi:MAG: lipid II:glycine glycyltransferase FemX [Patescibacteria group bacterium]|jgi:lipid II:glycine glycyltransferase (peptidoglycan interpeptide bridge formation enzyme)